MGILFLILVTDLAPSIALGLEPGQRGIMKERPGPKKQPILLPWMWLITVVNSIILADPHLLEGGERGQNGSSNPHGALALRGGNDLDLHGRGGQGDQLLLHAISDTGGTWWFRRTAQRFRRDP